MVVKDNQPTLRQNIESAFVETGPFSPYVQREYPTVRAESETIEKSRGRIKQRRMVSSAGLIDYPDWPHVGQVCQLVQTITKHGETTPAMEYPIAGVPREHADAAKLLSWWRNHWKIENQLHYVRDLTLGEDASRIRSRKAPENLTSVRNAAIGLLRRHRSHQHRRRFVGKRPQSQPTPGEPRHRIKPVGPGHLARAPIAENSG